jgi:hypothetical protein
MAHFPETMITSVSVWTRGVILFCLLMGTSIEAAEVVQVDVRLILTGRAVTTFTDGKLVPWTQGVDGGGRADGYLTLEAAVANGDQHAKALPDDGCFAANAVHPFARLNFANADGKNPQIRSVTGAGGFSIPVPDKRYQRMMIFLTSAEGPSHLRFQLTYADDTRESRDILLPDYYNAPPAGDTNVFTLAADLAKWNASGRMTEANHHNIHGVDLHPDTRKELVSVQMDKTVPGYMVFWGATGVSAD